MALIKTLITLAVIAFVFIGVPMFLIDGFTPLWSTCKNDYHFDRARAAIKKAEQGKLRCSPSFLARISDSMLFATGSICVSFSTALSSSCLDAQQAKRAKRLFGYGPPNAHGSIYIHMKLCRDMFERFGEKHACGRLSEIDKLKILSLFQCLLNMFKELDMLCKYYEQPSEHQDCKDFYSAFQSKIEKIYVPSAFSTHEDYILNTAEEILKAEKDILNSLHEVMNTLGSSPERDDQPEQDQSSFVFKHPATNPLAALERVSAAVKECKAPTIHHRFNAMYQSLSDFLTDPRSEQDIVRRLNSFYLPTLETAIQSLILGERKKSKKTAAREALCLQAISTVENVLLTQKDADDEADLFDLQAEVKAMENMARLKGDIPASDNVLSAKSHKGAQANGSSYQFRSTSLSV